MRFSVIVLLIAGASLTAAPARAVPIGLTGVSDFDYIKDGVTIVENLDKILKILNPNPVDGLSPKTSLTFAETAGQAALSLSGGNFGTPDTTQTFDITGTYWNINFGVTQDAAAVVGFDSVAISGAITHVKGPDAGDGIGTIFPFAAIFEFENPGCCGGGASLHPNMHRDDFDHSFNGTFTNIEDPLLGVTLSSDITTWTFALNAIHVPEPSTFLLLGSGLALILVLARKKLRGEFEAPSRPRKATNTRRENWSAQRLTSPPIRRRISKHSISARPL